MEQREPARPQVQATPDQLRATRELLADAGVPGDDVATNGQTAGIELPGSELSQHSVQPIAGGLNDLAGLADNRETPPDEHNQRDSDADILPD